MSTQMVEATIQHIPDDVWTAVREALATAGIPSTDTDYGNGTVFEVEAIVIARAILAERERCAKVADSFGVRTSQTQKRPFASGYVAASSRIAQAIRSLP